MMLSSQLGFSDERLHAISCVQSNRERTSNPDTYGNSAAFLFAAVEAHSFTMVAVLV
jgi:hypothetical protein